MFMAVTDVNRNIKKSDPDRKFRRVMSASTLTGDRVKNETGEDLGKVDDIMIDIPSGRIAYAVLSFGGFLGMGNKLFAIPWSSFTVDEDEKCFILNIDKATLENAPGFDKDNWPDMSEPSFRSQVYDYYGAEPYWDDTDTRDVKTFRGGGGL
jgi:sporulation protein YlmC with PRC-barrel domain